VSDLRSAAEWMVKVHADDVSIRGTALWEDLQALKAALADSPSPLTPEALPCGHTYPSGKRCGAPESVHRGEHPYQPWDRRSGPDRRASTLRAPSTLERGA